MHTHSEAHMAFIQLGLSVRNLISEFSPDILTDHHCSREDALALKRGGRDYE